jgi:hypothetical protein
MTLDNELQEWRRHWHAQPSVPMDLFRKVEDGTTHMRHLRVAEILVTVFMGGGTLAWAVFHPSTNWILLASGTWLAIIMAWIYSLRSTQGIWAATAPTTAAYLDLSIRRCRWKMRNARYDTVQGVLLSAFVLVIDYRVISEMKGAAPSIWLFVGLFMLFSVPLAVFFNSNRRKAEAELTYLLDLQQQMD